MILKVCSVIVILGSTRGIHFDSLLLDTYDKYPAETNVKLETIPPSVGNYNYSIRNQLTLSQSAIFFPHFSDIFLRLEASISPRNNS